RRRQRDPQHRADQADPGAAGQAADPDPARGRPPGPRSPLQPGLREAAAAGLEAGGRLRLGPALDGGVVPRPRGVVASDQRTEPRLPRPLPASLYAAPEMNSGAAMKRRAPA